jgi:hypothetical protein
MNKWLKGISLASILMLTAACSSGSSTPTTTTSTTLSPESAQVELDKLAQQSVAVDYSKISDSECGKFAIVVEPKDVRFYEWTPIGWQQDEAGFGDWKPDDTYLVTTNDYTNDGVNEFLLTFAREIPIGAIFGQIDCKWQWLPFQGQMGPEQRTVDGLKWSEDWTQLYGIDYDENWNKQEASFSWDPHYKVFMSSVSSDTSSDPDFNYDDQSVTISPVCQRHLEPLNYLYLEKRLTYAYVAYRSFINCTQKEWIHYAETHRSPFTTWETYFENYMNRKDRSNNTGVILRNDSARSVLDTACERLFGHIGKIEINIDRNLYESSACNQ